jgi:hypothetical protein
MIKAIAIMLFMVGIFIFGMSFHNIDLSVNAVNGAIDINGFGYQQDKLTMYLNGMAGMEISVIMLISGFALLFNIKDGIKWHGKA